MHIPFYQLGTFFIVGRSFAFYLSANSPIKFDEIRMHVMRIRIVKIYKSLKGGKYYSVDYTAVILPMLSFYHVVHKTKWKR